MGIIIHKVKLKKDKKLEYKVAVFGALISVLFSTIRDWILEKPFLSTLSIILKWIWNKFFEFRIPVWVIISVILLLVLWNKIKPRKKKTTISFLQYERDEFHGVQWKWNWERNSFTHKWNIINLAPICNNCGTTTILNESYVRIYSNCPRCDNTMNELKSTDIIKAIIVDNINRDLHLNKIKSI